MTIKIKESIEDRQTLIYGQVINGQTVERLFAQYRLNFQGKWEYYILLDGKVVSKRFTFGGFKLNLDKFIEKHSLILLNPGNDEGNQNTS